MSVSPISAARLAVMAASLCLPLGGCAYDYMQRSDRIAYSAGNAVKANLERETDDPARKSGTSTKGLGKNGLVIPPSDYGGGDSGS